MKFKKALIFILVIIIMTFTLIGCSKQKQDVGAITDNTVEKVLVVASTSWTALIAEAAGAKNVVILAPVELRHPPEYDFKPSDLKSVQDADFVIMGGYEPFMRKMIEANSIDENKIIQIRTTNTYDNLLIQTRAISEKLGTESYQENWVNEFKAAIDSIMEKASSNNLSSIKVLVHTHLAEFVKSLGYDVIGVFGAEELSPAKIGELASLKPDLIIDNYHNPQGLGIAEVSGSPRVELRNFPGPDHKTLINLFIDNATKLGLY